MKVVHISTHDTGGAAVAAYRLHRSLLDGGIESSFLVLYNSGQYPDVHTFKPGFYKFFLKKIRQRIRRIFTEEKTEDDRIEIFSSPDTYYDLSSSPLVRDAEIVHLHWVGNFLDYGSFFKKWNNKIIFWTLHDLNPIRGGFHYNLDSRYASTRLLKIENRYLLKKVKGIKNLNSVNIICPSNWVRKEIEKSVFNSMFKNCRVIRYGLNGEEFSLIDRKAARKKLNLPEGRTLILVVATNFQNYRKGFDMAVDVIGRMGNNNSVDFILVGSLENPPVLSNTIIFHSVKEIERLNLIYNAVDGVMLSSREDNLPNVMIEALVCGTPVFGFGVGGVKEIINPNLNGLTTSVITSDSLYLLTQDFISRMGAFKRSEIRSDALLTFDLKIQRNEVTKFYLDAINR